jgi:hypothetical protein
MAWITPTIDSLKGRLSDVELTKVGNAKLAPGQTLESVLAEVMEGVVRVVRGHAANKNLLGPAGTIPDELKDAFFAIVRFRVFTRLPNLGLIGEDRRTEYNSAEKLLAALAKGDFKIEQPETVSQERMAGTASEIVMSRPDHLGAANMDGL